MCSKKSAKKEKYAGLDLSLISDLKLISPEVIIYLTGTCRYANCQHCIIKDNFLGNYLSLDELRKIFFEMNALKIPFVSFTGGEFFDYEEGCENVIRLARDNNLFINQIITNASFATSIRKTIAKLKILKKNGFSAIDLGRKQLIPSLTISMDTEHQRFIPAENIRNLIYSARKVFGKYIDLTINYVLIFEEKKDVFKKYPWIKAVNVDFVDVCYEGRAKKIKNKKLFSVKDNLKNWNSPCNYLSKKWPSVPVIFPDGEISFCCYFGRNKILTLGNIRKDSLKKALSNINTKEELIVLFKYGPVKLFLKSNVKLKEKYTYNKCGFCNILLKNINYVRNQNFNRGLRKVNRE